ncbi:MAG: peroxiredoxin [Dokdonella sp.]|uniref:peroxiredoxin n=1 Tax=Dokdonella sp. TaxID=2291710 RepID=UPI0025B85D88|nr:peroxiredoxin [Dokdonella sp.]MBZ0224008.1 peroxiredoxin [Dokdonella sp.]MCC7255867.1 peroxiredoxin [Dokdonella sp.]
MLEIGKKLPRLRGVIDDGTTLALTELRGAHCLVYFYPKDNTPGCTNEAIAFRDQHARFRKLGCSIIGVSRDSVASHARFRAKHELPFPLVSDSDETWCKAFEVLGEKSLYGRKFVGVIRSSFLIDPQGVLIAQWRNVKVPGHADAVLERLAQP